MPTGTEPSPLRPVTPGRIALVLLLQAGFYALGAVLVLGLLGLPVWEIAVGTFEPLSLLAGAAGLWLAWTLLPPLTRWTAPGPRITREDQPELWAGHASLVDEVAQAGLEPDLVVVSVGGGGLLAGLCEGMHRHGWDQVPILAVETEGADSYARALAAGGPVTRPSIDSIALTLGAKTVCHEAWAWSQRRPIQPVRVSDADAVRACKNFLNDHRVLVEPSCGASLSLAYGRHAALSGRVLIVVCGGAAATLEDLAAWERAIGD